MGLPLKNWVIPLKNMGLPLKNFVKIKALPLKNSIFFNSTPKEILNFYNLPQENSMVPQPGGADIKCNSPIVSLDQLRLGVEEQLLIFSASCLSPGRIEKASKVHKLLSHSWP